MRCGNNAMESKCRVLILFCTLYEVTFECAMFTEKNICTPLYVKSDDYFYFIKNVYAFNVA